MFIGIILVLVMTGTSWVEIHKAFFFSTESPVEANPTEVKKPPVTFPPNPLYVSKTYSAEKVSDGPVMAMLCFPEYRS